MFKPFRTVSGDLVELASNFFDDLAILPRHIAKVVFVGAVLPKFLQVNFFGRYFFRALAGMGPANFAPEVMQRQLLRKARRRTKNCYLRHTTNPLPCRKPGLRSAYVQPRFKVGFDFAKCSETIVLGDVEERDNRRSNQCKNDNRKGQFDATP